MPWPSSTAELESAQITLGGEEPAPWELPPGAITFGGCFVCFGRGGAGPGSAGDAGWAAAVEIRGHRAVAGVVVTGAAPAPYSPGHLALREGPLLESAIRSLPQLPDVLLVNATGRDHPRRGGLALHLGAVLGIPSVGVTHRPLVATGEWPGPSRGARSPLYLEGELAGYWVRTAEGRRPLVAHAGWRTEPDVAAEVVLACSDRHRTPEPIRRARELARRARSGSSL